MGEPGGNKSVNGLGAALTVEMLKRDRASAIMNIVGVAVVALLHWEIKPAGILAGWSAYMLAVVVLRLLYTGRALGSVPDAPVVYTLLCGLAGIGWGLSLNLFNAAADPELFYYLRIIILSAALASATGTLSVRLAPFLTFVLTLFIPGAVTFILTAPGGRLSTLFISALLYLSAILAIGIMNSRRVREGIVSRLALEAALAELNEKNEELRGAISRINKLEGILPICASCKKIRDENGDWQHVETYITGRSNAEFSHGCCPECMNVLYPEFAGKIKG